jgi:hypothetical protein
MPRTVCLHWTSLLSFCLHTTLSQTLPGAGFIPPILPFVGVRTSAPSLPRTGFSLQVQDKTTAFAWCLFTLRFYPCAERARYGASAAERVYFITSPAYARRLPLTPAAPFRAACWRRRAPGAADACLRLRDCSLPLDTSFTYLLGSLRDLSAPSAQRLGNSLRVCKTQVPLSVAGWTDDADRADYSLFSALPHHTLLCWLFGSRRLRLPWRLPQASALQDVFITLPRTPVGVLQRAVLLCRFRARGDKRQPSLWWCVAWHIPGFRHGTYVWYHGRTCGWVCLCRLRGMARVTLRVPPAAFFVQAPYAVPAFVRGHYP